MDQVNRLTRVPLTPLAVRRDAAVLKVCEAGVEKATLFGFELEAESPVVGELFDAPDELGVLAASAFGLAGKNVSCPTVKPIAAASLPLPPMKIASVEFLLVMTNWPLLFSDTVTFAFVGKSILMALIRSPTVSVPVDV